MVRLPQHMQNIVTPTWNQNRKNLKRVCFLIFCTASAGDRMCFLHLNSVSQLGFATFQVVASHGRGKWLPCHPDLCLLLPLCSSHGGYSKFHWTMPCPLTSRPSPILLSLPRMFFLQLVLQVCLDITSFRKPSLNTTQFPLPCGWVSHSVI